MRSARIASIFLGLASLVHAQGRSGWTTFGGDPQRTGWNRAEDELTPESVKNLKLQWSLKLDIQPKALNGLTVPLVRANIQTPKGIKDLVIVAGVSDQVYVVDG